MIDLNLVGRKCDPIPYDYTWKDVVRYALSVGAQTEELPFIYENAKGGLKVIPSFVTILCHPVFRELFRDVEVDFSKFIHGEETIKLFGELPPQGRVLAEGEVANIYDKVKGALIIWRTRVRTESGELLAEVDHGIFYVGAGGFGGDPGPKVAPLLPPETVEPDFSFSARIPENQAALYRLNGDLNPLHLDPDFARMGGFPRPILHGLCTFGYATRALLHNVCGGDPARFKEFQARFSGVVYPGDTLVVEGWHDRGGRYLVRCRTDHGVVLSHASVEVE